MRFSMPLPDTRIAATGSKAFLILGTAFLIYWTRFFREEGIHIWRSEMFFSTAIILAFFHICFEKNHSWKLDLRAQEYLLSFSLLIASLFVASCWSALWHDVYFTKTGVRLLILLFLNMALFLTADYFLNRDDRLFRYLCWALCIPPLFFIPFLFVPDWAYGLSLLTGLFVAPGTEGRFIGLTTNPSNFSQSAMISLCFVYALTLFHGFCRQYMRALFFAFLVLGLLGLLFWAQSKGFLIATAIVIVFETFLICLLFGKRAPWILPTLGILCIGVVLIFFFLPQHVRSSFLARMSAFHMDDRLWLWSYYSDLFSHNPLGLGFNYTEAFALKRPEIGDPLPAHNVILDTVVFGGMGALLALAGFLGSAFLNLADRFRQNEPVLCAYDIAIGSAIVGMFVACLVEGSPLYFLGFWILMALALKRPNASPKGLEAGQNVAPTADGIP